MVRMFLALALLGYVLPSMGQVSQVEQLFGSITLVQSLPAEDQSAETVTSRTYDGAGQSPELDPGAVALGRYLRWVTIIMVVSGIGIYITLRKIRHRHEYGNLARRLTKIFKVMVNVVLFFFFGLGGINILMFWGKLLFNAGIGTSTNLIIGILSLAIGFLITRIKLP